MKKLRHSDDLIEARICWLIWKAHGKLLNGEAPERRDSYPEWIVSTSMIVGKIVLFGGFVASDGA